MSNALRISLCAPTLIVVQLCVGSALLGWPGSLFPAARGRHEWAVVIRILRRSFRLALPAAVTLLVLSRIAGTALPIREAWAGWIHGVLGGLTTTGCLLLMAAGAMEHRGALRLGRRVSRIGGLAMAAGAALQLTPGLLGVLESVESTGSGPANRWQLSAATVCWIAWTAAGIAGLLAGLSGKPRPTGGVAAALLAAGALLWAATWAV